MSNERHDAVKKVAADAIEDSGGFLLFGHRCKILIEIWIGLNQDFFGTKCGQFLPAGCVSHNRNDRNVIGECNAKHCDACRRSSGCNQNTSMLVLLSLFPESVRRD